MCTIMFLKPNDLIPSTVHALKRMDINWNVNLIIKKQTRSSNPNLVCLDYHNAAMIASVIDQKAKGGLRHYQ